MLVVVHLAPQNEPHSAGTGWPLKVSEQETYYQDSELLEAVWNTQEKLSLEMKNNSKTCMATV